MPKLQRMSGDDVIAVLATFGFAIVSQKGSHVKLRRTTDTDVQTLTIPRHKELDKGTLQAIYRQAGRYVDEARLKPEFYTSN